MPGEEGRFVNPHAASKVVNLRDGVSNLFRFNGANSRPIGPNPTKAFFDTTALKAGR